MVSQTIYLLLLVGLTGVVLTAIAPFLTFLIIAAGITWVLIETVKAIDKQRNAKLMQKIGTINRAHKQHNQIVSGNIEAGTYGNYLPPQGLR
jgi:hypothetical protein